MARSPAPGVDDAGAGDDAHRDRVHEAAHRSLDKDADLIQRLRDDDGDNGGGGAAWVERLRSGSRLRDLIDDDNDSDVDDAPDDNNVGGRPVGGMP